MSTGHDDEGAALARAETALLGRWPESRIAPSRDRITALLDLLGSPHRAYPVIHVAGTNGKTSTARIIDALLRGFGLHTGRYTSPHLESITERITFDGEPIEPARFAAVHDELVPYFDLIDSRFPEPLSFFEAVTAMAFAAFADAPVDVAVIEVGMGGTWDATNVVDGQVSVITPIALDHQRFLGDTLAEIAGEKAGIVRPDAVTVIAQQPLEAGAVLMTRCAEVGATVAREGLEFGVLRRDLAVGGQQLTLQGLGGVYEDLFLPLHGAHQAQNAACALAAVEAFLGGGTQPLDVDAVRDGISLGTSPGRLEVARRAPTVLLDVAHNPAGAQATAQALAQEFAFTRLIGVVAVLDDKDAAGLLEAFEPVLTMVVATQNGSRRSMPVDQLAALAVDVFGEDRVDVESRLDDALETAIALAEEEGDLAGVGVLVTGSVVTVGEARRLLRRR